ncbi:MAG TPA: hypothetical protein VFW64_11435 [Pseudonocardiaceae bacterium]|nr:hypothetical protein [Pseudonocardiaceae bacterium]
MSNNLTFAELEAQHVELLPARTVLSLFSVPPPGPQAGSSTCGWPCIYIHHVTGTGTSTSTSIQSAGFGHGGAPG